MDILISMLILIVMGVFVYIEYMLSDHKDEIWEKIRKRMR